MSGHVQPGLELSPREREIVASEIESVYLYREGGRSSERVPPEELRPHVEAPWTAPEPWTPRDLFDVRVKLFLLHWWRSRALDERVLCLSRALRDLDHLLELFPYDQATWSLRAAVFFGRHQDGGGPVDLDRAIADLERAHELEPTRDDFMDLLLSRTHRGILRAERGEVLGALEDLETILLDMSVMIQAAEIRSTATTATLHYWAPSKTQWALPKWTLYGALRGNLSSEERTVIDRHLERLAAPTPRTVEELRLGAGLAFARWLRSRDPLHADLAPAIAILSRAIAAAPEDVRAWQIRGALRLCSATRRERLSELDAAISDLERTRELDPASHPTLLRHALTVRGKSALLSCDRGGAISALSRLLEISPRDSALAEVAREWLRSLGAESPPEAGTHGPSVTSSLSQGASFRMRVAPGASGQTEEGRHG